MIWKARRIGIVFVSHKLEELFELCDRDDEFVATKRRSSVGLTFLTTAMAGVVRWTDSKKFGENSGVLEITNGDMYSSRRVINSGLYCAVGAGLTGAVRRESDRGGSGARSGHIKSRAINAACVLTEEPWGQGLVAVFANAGMKNTLELVP